MMAEGRSRYRAVVFHGSTSRGFTLWRRGQWWRERAQAEAEGRRMADICKRVVGGTPTIMIEED